MTWGRLRMKLRMVSPLGDTTLSSTCNIQQVVTDSRIGLGHFTKKSDGSSGNASRFTTRLYTML
jgi:hypothetical protein